MSVKEAVLAALKELVLPELQILKLEQGELKATLGLTNKRLDDMNIHLLNQSRRIDAVREDLSGRIDETHKRIDETNKRLDRLYEVIVRREEHQT
jgi:hypothetical protein